jgi:hypothetical protein
MAIVMFVTPWIGPSEAPPPRCWQKRCTPRTHSKVVEIRKSRVARIRDTSSQVTIGLQAVTLRTPEPILLVMRVAARRKAEVRHERTTVHAASGRRKFIA